MLEVLILAFALSMDAFAVSIGLGIKNKQNLKALALKAGLFFGIFQALMPFLFYFLLLVERWFMKHLMKI